MDETPLQRLRRLEAEERGEKQGGAAAAGSAAAAGGVLLLLAKGKFLLAALKLAPFLGTLSTMAVSAALYARLYGASLAIGLVLLILLHELGHGAAAKALGLRVGAPIFIPFLGAFIALKEQPRSSWVETRVALAGPAAGLLGVGICFAWAAASPERSGLALALAHVTMTLNLFNLLPAASLDGDRATRPLAPRQWLAVLAALALLLAATREPDGALHPILLLLALLGGWKGWRSRSPSAPVRLVDRLAASGPGPDEAGVTESHRWASAAMYAGLCAALSCLNLVVSPP